MFYVVAAYYNTRYYIWKKDIIISIEIVLFSAIISENLLISDSISELVWTEVGLRDIKII